MALWIAADSATRDQVTRAVAEIDRELQRDAAHAGESRDSGRRILIEEPLGAYFRVDRQQIAVVSHVWRFTTH